MMRYLLGVASDEERLRLEQCYFADDRVFAQLSAFEDELIDHYIRGELAEPQRKQFEHHFLNSAERREKLAFAESFVRYLSNLPLVVSSPKPEAWHERMTDWLGLRGVPARWAFTATLAAVVVGGVWLVQENWRLQTQLREMQAQQTELRQRDEQLRRQLDQLKLPAIAGTPGPEVAQSQAHSLPIVAVTLVPGVLRSSAEQNTLIIPLDPHLVRLQLEVDSRQPHDSYVAILETAEGVTVWSTEGLKTIPQIGGHTLAMELPSSLLSNNDYILKLRGVRSGAVQTNQHRSDTQHPIGEEIAAYSFRVVKR
jgi:hypothetical protein